MNKKSRFKVARRILLFLTLFIGLCAVGGAVGMLVDPTGKLMGMDEMLPYFKVLPFSDVLFKNLTFSGVALFIVNGITNLSAFALILAKKRIGIILGGIFGITLMLWICIQFYIFPSNFMSSSFFAVGLVQAVTGYAAYVFFKQENFYICPEDYKNIGTNSENAVVYFSRMGYVKKIAYEEADRTGAVLYEIRSTERTEGTLGFWWCGRYGMHRWDMPIKHIDEDFSIYKKVTICSPVWVFGLAAPTRAFCRQNANKIKNIDCILVHYQKSKYNSVVKEIEALLGTECSGFRSICCRLGKYKEICRYI